MDLSLIRTFLRISLLFFILCGLHCTELDDKKSDQIAFIKYHIPEGLRFRLDAELPVIIAGGNYAARIARYLQNPDNLADKGNPNLIVLEKIGSANRWSLLCLCVDRGHEELVFLLRQQGAYEDYRDSYGITSLHRAAFRGHSIITQLLLKPMGNTGDRRRANALLMDDLGLTAGDYLRIALDRDLHGCHEIESLLEKAEKYELRKRMNQSVQLRNFISAFRKWSKDNLTAEQVLSIGTIARSSNFLSFSNLFSVLSNVVPAGVSTVTTIAGVVASSIEDYLADQETQNFLDHTSCLAEDVDDMNREFIKLAYYLADIYEGSIQALKPTGAERLGKNTAKYVAEYIKKIDISRPRNISFVKQVEEYFLAIEDPGFGSRKELDKDGEKWHVHAVLNRSVGSAKASSKSTKHAGLAALIHEDRIVDGTSSSFDVQEVARIELLLNGSITSYAAISSEQTQPIAQPKHTEKLSFSAKEQEKKTTISVGKGIGDAHVKKDVKMSFTSGGDVAVVSNPHARITVGNGAGNLEIDGNLDMTF